MLEDTCLLDIELNQLNRGDYTFTSNEKLTGNVLVKLTQTVQVSRIDLVFDGLIKVTKVKKVQNIDDLYRLAYTKQCIYPLLPQSQVKQVYRMIGGEYQFPFKIEIPTRNLDYKQEHNVKLYQHNIDGDNIHDLLYQIPPSFNESYYATVNYKLKVFVRDENEKIKHTFVKAVTVIPRQAIYEETSQGLVRSNDIFKLSDPVLEKMNTTRRKSSSATRLENEETKEKRSGSFGLFKRKKSVLPSTNQSFETFLSGSSAVSFVSDTSSTSEESSLNGFIMNYMDQDEVKGKKHKKLIAGELDCLRTYPSTPVYLQMQFLEKHGFLVRGSSLKLKLFLITTVEPSKLKSLEGETIKSLLINSLNIDLISVTTPIHLGDTSPKEYASNNLLRTKADFNFEISLNNEDFEKYYDPTSRQTCYRHEILYSLFPKQFFWNHDDPSACLGVNYDKLLLPEELLPSFTTGFISRRYKLLVCAKVQPSSSSKVAGNSTLKKKFVKVYKDVVVQSEFEPLTEAVQPVDNASVTNSELTILNEPETNHEQSGSQYSVAELNTMTERILMTRREVQSVPYDSHRINEPSVLPAGHYVPGVNRQALNQAATSVVGLPPTAQVPLPPSYDQATYNEFDFVSH